MPAPPLPKCFSLLETAYFTNLIAQIDAASVEADLQALVDQVFGDLSVLESTITSQIGFVNLITPLLAAPGDLGALVTWAGNFVTFLQQVYLPYLNLAAQLTALATQIANLTAAINAIATAKGWTISVPTVSVICEL